MLTRDRHSYKPPYMSICIFHPVMEEEIVLRLIQIYGGKSDGERVSTCTNPPISVRSPILFNFTGGRVQCTRSENLDREACMRIDMAWERYICKAVGFHWFRPLSRCSLFSSSSRPQLPTPTHCLETTLNYIRSSGAAEKPSTWMEYWKLISYIFCD